MKTEPPIRSDRTPPEHDSAYLQRLGENIRALRARREITRKTLAQRSGVSERFLAQLEGGTGNASVLILRRIAAALQVDLQSLLAEQNGNCGSESKDLAHTFDFLRRLDEEDIAKARGLLHQHFGDSHFIDESCRRQRIALIGLRGAGKSTLGAHFAKEMNVPFIELDRLVEEAAGTPLSMIFDLYGQTGFRRFERRCLDEVLEKHPRFVLATGGSIVSEAETFEKLLRECFTVWMRATPEEHMQRVIAQGDMRPMAHNPGAMSELKQILQEREPLYLKANLTLDTSGRETADLSREMRDSLILQRA
ncbi:MAG TPA: helix-turn-helix transcriptional regulator [Terriglobales bacterium]|nr:helix-turn-helix transcriptional regulator [Terriglobales bacterium]